MPGWGGGYFMSSSRRVRTIVSEMTQLRNHLWSAGTTYHGACSVEHFSKASSYASTYSSQRLRSSRSLALNFQFLLESCSRASSRRFCSSGNHLKQTLRRSFRHGYVP